MRMHLMSMLSTLLKTLRSSLRNLNIEKKSAEKNIGSHYLNNVKQEILTSLISALKSQQTDALLI
ncbi:hypothetical protein D3C86_1343180 [compost metagenome]